MFRNRYLSINSIVCIMKNQTVFTKAIYCLLGILIVFISCVWLYDFTQLKGQEVSQTAEGSSSSLDSANYVRYENERFNVSFVHPNGWHCETSFFDPVRYRQTTPAVALDTSCVGELSDDRFISIVSPYYYDWAEDELVQKVIRSSTVAGKDGMIKKTIYKRCVQNDCSGGIVDYTYGDFEAIESFSAYAFYGVGQLYESAEEAELVLDPLIKSIEPGVVPKE